MSFAVALLANPCAQQHSAVFDICGTLSPSATVTALTPNNATAIPQIGLVGLSHTHKAQRQPTVLL